MPVNENERTYARALVHALARVRTRALPLSLPLTHARVHQVEMERWLQTHETSPLTNEKLPNKTLLPNNNLRMQIQAFEDTMQYSVS